MLQFFLMLSNVNISSLFSLKISRCIDYYRKIHFFSISFISIFIQRNSSTIRNFVSNGYSRGVNNRVTSDTTLVPMSIKNVDKSSCFIVVCIHIQRIYMYVDICVIIFIYNINPHHFSFSLNTQSCLSKEVRFKSIFKKPDLNKTIVMIPNTVLFAIQQYRIIFLKFIFQLSLNFVGFESIKKKLISSHLF